MSLSLQDLQIARQFVERLVSDPRYLDWFSSDELTTRSGETIHDPDLVVKRQRIYAATLTLADLLEDLETTVLAAETTQAWQPPGTTKSPPGLESFFWRSLKYQQLHFEASPWRFILTALTGQLHAAMIIVSERHVKGAPQGATLKYHRIFG